MASVDLCIRQDAERLLGMARRSFRAARIFVERVSSGSI
jgi:hypothetical protein